MTNISRAAQNAKVKTLSKNSALSLRKLPERRNTPILHCEAK
jgi:hypothetical protein